MGVTSLKARATVTVGVALVDFFLELLALIKVSPKERESGSGSRDDIRKLFAELMTGILSLLQASVHISALKVASSVIGPQRFLVQLLGGDSFACLFADLEKPIAKRPVFVVCPITGMRQDDIIVH
jgi:hypothetical protein